MEWALLNFWSLEGLDCSQLLVELLVLLLLFELHMLMGYSLIIIYTYKTHTHICGHLRVVTYISTSERHYEYLFFWVWWYVSKTLFFIHALKLSPMNLLWILNISILFTWTHLEILIQLPHFQLTNYVITSFWGDSVPKFSLYHFTKKHNVAFFSVLSITCPR